jgi:hypothetical protein
MFLIFILLFYIFFRHFEGHSTVANKKEKGKDRSNLIVRTRHAIVA